MNIQNDPVENQKAPVYIYDKELVSATNSIPHLNKRGEMVHELIKSYRLLGKLIVRPSTPATEEDLLTFHSQTYLEFLSSPATDDVTSSQQQILDDEFGLGYDCPKFEDMRDFAYKITGGTLTAAKYLVEGTAKVAINWCGGWHHAQRNEASGFCYVNDIVIGIQFLLKRFKKVLYIDLDAHHGDGVENAFSYSNKVMTLSLHNFEAGYFPGTGDIQNVGFGRGKYHSVNVPLKSGLVDEQFTFVFDRVFEAVQHRFEADAIVVQCGADCLSGDPLGSFNLTEKSLIHCVQNILRADKPTMFLGGGGYDLQNAARCWTSLTATILGEQLSYDIPDNNPHFLEYGPCFTLEVAPGLRKNENSRDYLKQLVSTIEENLDNL